ncbi:unnamed protein product, partial [Polarella glacialis]
PAANLQRSSSSYCKGFSHVPGKWYTEVRTSWSLHRNWSARANSSQPLRIAVLLGSMLRSPISLRHLDTVIAPHQHVEWALFVATAGEGHSADCRRSICSLRHLQAISLVDLNSTSRRSEYAFARRMGSSKGLGNSFRQFFKLARAYELMQEFEASTGLHFDAVLKMRSDFAYGAPAPLKLDAFPELAKPFVYMVSDVLFFCNRQVAAALLQNLKRRLLRLKDTDHTLLPIHYDRLLQSELDDTDIHTWNYPCIPGAQHRLRRALLQWPGQDGEPHSWGSHRPLRSPRDGQLRSRQLAGDSDFDAVSEFRSLGCSVLETSGEEMAQAHQRLPPLPDGVDPLQDASPWCTGAFWNNISVRRDLLNSRHARILGDGRAVQAGKAWSYLAHMAEPPVYFRLWPSGGIEMHPLRHLPLPPCEA